ncbi:unnamed protein product, partial [marine sediment metagenome]
MKQVSSSNKLYKNFTFCLTALLMFYQSAFSQAVPTSAEDRLKSWEHHLKLKNESIFKDPKWRAVGPQQQGGRIEAVAVHPEDHKTIYVG